MYDLTKIRLLSDGIRTSAEIGILAGCPTKYVQRVQLRENLPRLKQGPGLNNPDWNGGMTLQRDGYLLVLIDHPHSRKTGYFLAHRLVMEISLGRLLKRSEVVDHINGLTLDNRPENLRLFESNSAHLKQTLSGLRPKWSTEGMKVISSPKHTHPRVNTYLENRRSGAERERQIHLLNEQLGINERVLLRKALNTALKKNPHPLLTIPDYLLEDPQSE